MMYRLLMMLLVGTMLSGCFWKYQPANLAYTREAGTESSEIPPLVNSDAALEAWVAYGLASQRNDQVWREEKLDQIDAFDEQTKLAQAVLLSWGGENQWKQAAQLYEEGISLAPPLLEPLFRYWMKELDRRRELSGQLKLSESQRQRIGTNNNNNNNSSISNNSDNNSNNDEKSLEIEALRSKLRDMTEKLDALTDIERNINQRQPAP